MIPLSKRTVITSASIALALAITVTLIFVAQLPATGGPLAGSSPFGYALVLPKGAVVTDAYTLLLIEKGVTDSVELVSIEQLYSDPALQSGGEWLAGEDRSRESQIVQQYYLESPPVDDRLGTIREISGAIVSRDDQGFYPQLLLATEVVSTGHHLRDGLWVTYRYQGKTYRDYIPAKMTICTPDALDAEGECPFLGDDDEQAPH